MGREWLDLSVLKIVRPDCVTMSDLGLRENISIAYVVFWPPQSLIKINCCCSTSVFYSTISRHLLHRWLHFDFAKKQLIYKGLQLQMLSNNTDLIFTIYLSFWWNSLSAFCGLIAIDSSFEPLYPKVFRGTQEVDLESIVCPPHPPKVRWCRFLATQKGRF